MALNLHEGSSAMPAIGHLSIDQMTWWFWVKAGMGFSIGYGIVYATTMMAYLFILTKSPSLFFLRQLLR